MLKEQRTRGGAVPPERTRPHADIEQTAHDLVKRLLHTAHVQKQLGFTEATMEQILPVATSYYLFWTGHNILAKPGKRSDTRQSIANKYVVAAMQVYPNILDEIDVEHTHQRPLDATSPHDVALYLGVRLAQTQSTSGNEIHVLKQLQADVEEIREIARSSQQPAKIA